MTIKEIQEKILNDDAFVVTEIEKILTYYQLKHTLRWSHDSNEIDDKESVAEHVYGMYILCDYFLPLQTHELDYQLVRDLVLWHDMAEALVDDMSTMTKTATHINKETEAEKELLVFAPLHIQNKLSEVFSTYEAQTTAEAKFVKAIDKIEPLFQLLFNQNTLKQISDLNKKARSDEIMDFYHKNRLQYINTYPDITKFSNLLNTKIKSTDFIHPEA